VVYSSTDITSEELDGYDLDCPFFVGANLLKESVISHAAFSSSGDPTTATDRSEEFAPIERVYDGLLDLPCVMSQHHAFNYTSAGTTRVLYLSFKFSSPLSFDTLILAGHNAISDRYLQMRLVISNLDDLEAHSFHIISGGDVSTFLSSSLCDYRHTDTSLGTGSTPKIFSGVEHLAVSFYPGGEHFAPRLGELVLGKRRQLQHHPEFSWNPDDYKGTTSDFHTNGGNVFRYTLARGQAVRRVTLTLTSAAEVAAVEAWWSDCNHGKDPFWWVETPKSDPRAFLMRVVNAQLDFPQSFGSEGRTLTLDMIEQSPFYIDERSLS